MVVEKMPEFPGGTMAIQDYLVRNIYYPPEAREAGETGKAYVQFIVDTNGAVINPKIIKSSGSKSLNKEALRVVKKMPKWIAGEDSGKKANVYVNLPIAFSMKSPTDDKNTPQGFSLGTKEPESKEKHEKAMKYWNDGHKLELEEKFDYALEKFNKSLEIEPENKYSMFDKAKILMVLGQKEKACQIWDKMIQSKIRKDEAQEFIQKYCNIENGPKEMVKAYTMKKAATFFNSGMEVLQTGRYEAALKRFDSCLKYNPEHKNALFNKAAMHYKLDQKKAACDTWKKLQAIDPEDKETEDLINKKCK
jgi:TonB family protein